MPVRSIVDPFAQRIGARMRDLRQERGMSLAAMQTACGVSKGHLSNIERGQVLLNVVTLYTIAQGLGVEVVEILIKPHSPKQSAAAR